MVFELVREEVFTFTPEGENEEICIRSGQLREWLMSWVPHKVIDLTFPANESEESIIARHGLEAPRMASMTEDEANEPVIIAVWPSGNHVLIDGGHRRWFWAKRGVNVLKGWVVPEAVWRGFVFNPADLPGLIFHAPDGSLLPQRMK